MKKLLIAAVFAAMASPAFAAVGVSLNIGEPGFYGRIDLNDSPKPRLYSSRPVFAGARVSSEPVYLRVPYSHRRNWKSYCGRYGACGRPVYFVDDSWYRTTYAPLYRSRHHNGNDHDGVDRDGDGRDRDGRKDNHR